ncbi:hypothetical protein EC991_009625 [Linnemannia zychae]|nr:hypothetical protein EC991_009625 [Linnemannia zychae]
MPQKKRGPLHGSRQGVKPHLSSTIGQLESSITDPKHPIQNSRLQQSWEAHAQELEQRLWPNPSPDPFSKEVQDHLVEVFFEFCFEDFNCFSPARFLKSYSQGSLSPCLLDAVCAVAARFSNHPAVVTIPPCKSGEPFASRIRSRMGEIVVEVNIDTVHTLVLLGFYEYISGNHLRGYRFEGIAGRMAPELQLHRAFAQRMVGPFTSDEERVTTEIKVRTFARLLGSDCANSAVAGIPPLFDSTLFEPWIVPYDGDWWVESPSARMIGNYREEEPINAAYVHILHKVLRPRPIREFGDPSLTVPILQVAISVWRFINSGEVPKSISAQPSPSNMHPSSPVIVMSALPSTPLPRPQKDQATPLHWRESIPDIQMLDAAAETWKYQLSEEQLPNNAKSSVWRTDINSIHSSLHYYILQISLYRSVLLRAGMAIDSHAKGQDRIQGQSDSTGESGRPTKLDSDPESTEENLPTADTLANKKDKMFLRMAMEKCYNSANEITAIIDQFSERLVKIRGSHLSFSVFIAGTAHVLQLTTSKNPVQVAQAKRGLLSCLRFFRTLEPYWAASKDQAKFLESLLNTHNAKTEKPNDNDLELIHKHWQQHDGKQEQHIYQFRDNNKLIK